MTLELVVNLRRVLKKLHDRLEPGNDEHSSLIDLVNYADTIAHQIENEQKRNLQ